VLLEQAAAQLMRASVELVVLECFGHTLAMKEKVKRLTDLPVVLVRSILARVVAELA